jgi:hypothetical protein
MTKDTRPGQRNNNLLQNAFGLLGSFSLLQQAPLGLIFEVLLLFFSSAYLSVLVSTDMVNTQFKNILIEILS